MKVRISAKLMLAATLGVLALASVVSFTAYRMARDGLERQIFSHLESVAQSRAAHVRTYLGVHKSVVQTAASDPDLAAAIDPLSGPREDCSALIDDIDAELQYLIDPGGYVYEASLIDSRGEIVASTAPEKVGLDMSAEACFVGARDGPFVRDAYRSDAGKGSLAVSAPVLDGAAGGLLGVLVTYHDMAVLNNVTADRTGLGATGETYLINKYGFMITPSRFREDTFLKQKVDSENARRCLAHVATSGAGAPGEKHTRDISVFTDYRGVDVLGGHAGIPEVGWGLLAEIDAGEAFGPIARLRLRILLFGVVFAAAALALAYFLARRISRPIHELHVGSERIGNGELDYRVHIRTRDEIEQLADEFNSMAEKLQASYASLEAKVAERTADLTREVAEHEAAAKALRESEGKYRLLVENLPQRIFVKDKSLVYISCSENYARDLDIAPEEIAGKTDHDFHPAELAEKYRADDKRIMEAGKTEEIEERYVRGGREAVVQTVKTPIRDERGETAGILGIFWDITERKRAEAELKQAQAHLVQSEKMASIGQLAAGVAHEINNPTGFVMSNIGTLREYVETLKKLLAYYDGLTGALREEDRDRQQEILSAVDVLREQEDVPYILEDVEKLLSESAEGTERIRDIVRNLKSFARMDEAAVKEVDVNEGIEATLKIVWNELKYKCQVHKELGEIPRIRCNPGQLNQVFVNLLLNAAQAISEQGDVTIRTEADDGEVLIRVTDTGRGIPPDDLRKIFDPFFTTKDVGKGTGLGLSISHGIVEKHGGKIEVESEVGKGTTFTVRLPVRGVNDE